MDQHDTGVAEANAVRDPPQAQVFIFPDSEIVRWRPSMPRPKPDQVVVTHNGETEVYDSPSALYAAFAAADPERKARLAEADRAVGEAQTQLARARDVLAAAYQRQRQAERLLRLVLAGCVVAGVLAVALLAGAL